MKKLLCSILAAAMLCGCTAAPIETTPPESVTADSAADRWMLEKGGLEISVPGGMAENAITAAREGDGHTVVRINAPGTYILSGRLDAGQIAVDLGENAGNDPNAVVTLVLDGLDITCTVAPAIIIYNVYECGNGENPAGANVVLAPGSRNYVNGSHTEEYDGAFYSEMSMTIGGTGSLNITADKEGLCSEMHLTINNGTIHIHSGNDGINANADGVSVVTVRGGEICVTVTGETGEGDGIDSNGSIVISGGAVEAYACGGSSDSGLDADMGIHINGGSVIATGNMLDSIGDSTQTYAVFSFHQLQQGGNYRLNTEAGDVLFDITAPNSFTNLLLSDPKLTEGDYTLWCGDTQFEGAIGGGFFGELQPIERPDWPGRGDSDVEIPPQPTVPIVTHGIVQPPQGDGPENMPVPPMPEGGGNMPVPPQPEGSTEMPMPQTPAGVMPPQDGRDRQPVAVFPADGLISDTFPIHAGANYFYMVRPIQ